MLAQALWVTAPHLCGKGQPQNPSGDVPKSSFQVKGRGEDRTELPVLAVHKLAHKQPVSGSCEQAFGFGVWKETNQPLHPHSSPQHGSGWLLLLEADVSFVFMH